MFTPDDNSFMSRALVLAEHGRLTVSPNPMVGCVIVRDGAIVGEGYHQRAGEAHAEIHALQSAGGNAKGATAYVTLEPCCHHGRTPPCTDALIQSGIKKIVIACRDANPLVSGKGIETLRASGIEVVVGVLEQEAIQLNEIFFHYITKRRPYIIAKWAMSLDGKTITHPGDDKKISSDIAHQQVHQTRECVDAILVGANTAIHDDPLLTVRYSDHVICKQPIRIILSSRGKLPPELRLLNTNEIARAMVITTDLIDEEQRRLFVNKGIDILIADKTNDNQVDLHDAMAKLAKSGISRVLVEGGRTLHDSFFEARLVDKVDVYLAPVIIGKLDKKVRITQLDCQACGIDFHISGTHTGVTTHV